MSIFNNHGLNESPIKNKLPRNGFDLSHSDKFSFKAGFFQPIFKMDVLPGDHVDIDMTASLRMRPLNTAAYARLRFQTKYFFVPYSQIWSGWRSFITGLPLNQTANSRLLQNGSTLNNDLILNHNTVPFSCTLQMLCNALYSIKTGGSTYNLNHYNVSLINPDARVHMIMRILDMLDIIPYSILKTTFDAYETFPTSNVPEVFSTRVNFAPLLAWNKIIQDTNYNYDYEYRQYSAFSCDYRSITQGVLSTWLAYSLEVPMRDKDFFTNIKPNALYTQASSVINQYMGNSPVVGKNDGSTGEGNLVGVTDATLNTGVPGISLDALRSSLALERLLEVSRRAGKTYESQILAHYGYKTPKNLTDDLFVHYIGGNRSFVDINMIVSQADTLQQSSETNVTGAGIGSFGGLGLGNPKSHVKFDVPEHGVIIGMAYLVPEQDYKNYGLSPFAQKLYREDFFQPESENLGYQPILVNRYRLPASSYDLGLNPVSGYSKYLDDVLTKQVGWQTRYSEYKTAVDKVHFDFNDENKTLGHYVAPVEFFFNPESDANGGELGEYRKIIMQYYDVDTINPIMASQITEDNASSFDSDVADINMHHKVLAVRNMSRDGLPY